MFPWIRKEVLQMSSDDLDFLVRESVFICKNANEVSFKDTWCKKIGNLLDKFPFLRVDIQNAYEELVNTDFKVTIPKATLDYVRSYFFQFTRKINSNSPVVSSPAANLPDKKESQTIKKEDRVLEIQGEVWYVLYHGRLGYVLGKLVEDYEKRYVVDVYKAGKLLKAGWSIDKENQRIISVLDQPVKLDDQDRLLSCELDSWMRRLLEEGRKLKKKTKKRVFIAINYLHGILPCVAEVIDENSYHFDVYDKGICVQRNWVVGRSTRRQILKEIL